MPIIIKDNSIYAHFGYGDILIDPFIDDDRRNLSGVYLGRIERGEIGRAPKVTPDDEPIKLVFHNVESLEVFARQIGDLLESVKKLSSSLAKAKP